MDTSSLLNGLPLLNEVIYLLYYQPRIYLSKTKVVSIVHYVYTNIRINVIVTLFKSKPKYQQARENEVQINKFSIKTCFVFFFYFSFNRNKASFRKKDLERGSNGYTPNSTKIATNKEYLTCLTTLIDRQRQATCLHRSG